MLNQDWAINYNEDSACDEESVTYDSKKDINQKDEGKITAEVTDTIF